jgi:hypothetical protein
MLFQTMPKVAPCQENVNFGEKNNKINGRNVIGAKRVLDSFCLTLVDAKSLGGPCNIT